MDDTMSISWQHHGRGRRWLGSVALCGAIALALIGPVAASAQETSTAPQPLSAAAAPSNQFAPTGEPSINVTGTGSASAPAESALIQIVVSSSFEITTAISGMGVPEPAPASEPTLTPGDVPPAEQGTPAAGASEQGSAVEPGWAPAGGGMNGMPRLSDRDLQPLVDAMIAAGVDEASIEVATGPSVASFYGPGGPGGGRLDATIDGPTRASVDATIEAVDRAATRAGLTLQYVGVAYDLADCSTLVRDAKKEAIQDARDRATELASLLGVTLGEMLSAYDNSYFGVTPPTGTGCPPSPNYGGVFGPESTVTAPPYDPSLPADARVISGVSLAFAFGTSA